MPKTTVVLPTYNEIENLPLMIESLFALNIEGLKILVVDDNSPDGTGDKANEFAEQYPNRVFVLHRPGKGGLGKAYVAGYRYVIANLETDYIIQMDCDFSHQPKYVPQLIAEIGKGYDFVLGSRYVPGGGVEEKWSPYRKLLSWFANRVYVSLFLDVPVKDATGGFRIWKKDTLIGLNLERIQSNGYMFQVEMAYVAHKLGYEVSEIPIHFPDRELGNSKMGFDIQVEAALGVFRLWSDYHNLEPTMRRTDPYTAW
jgi:dolichol-phosphate mannosyltransferase